MNIETSDRRLADECLIDERCDAFEAAWRAGQRPNIDEFITCADSSLQARLFGELLLVELEIRKSSGEQPSRKEYLKRFPQFAAQIEATNFRYGLAAFVESSADEYGKPSAAKYSRGTHVGRYELLEHLGAGAMGEAWKAVDTLLGRAVTIKLPHGDLVNETEWRRFKREAEIAAQLSHPAIASVLTLEREDHRFYLVAGYVEGMNLRDYASTVQLSFDDVAEVCAAICDAIQYAHEKGVVHRDLKPANIIIDPQGRPHVIDFGLAKIATANNDLTVAGELLGTIAYMSPELAEGNGAHADFKTDIYSLGVVLFELLTSRRPFSGTGSSIVAQILSAMPERPRAVRQGVPADLETICLKGIEKEPLDRYASAGEMAKDLRRYVARLPIHARRIGVFERCSRWTRRHPVIAASTVVVMAVVMAVITIITTLYHQNQRLAGLRPVRITSTPSGARLAIVPLDPNTNEPYPDLAGIVKPSATTPLNVQLRPGDYLVEALLPSGATPTFVDVYRTVVEPSRLSASNAQANVTSGLDSETCHFSDIDIPPKPEDVQKMVLLTISDNFRRDNSLIPKQLYVDIQQTTAAELKATPEFMALVKRIKNGAGHITYANAAAWAERNHKNLPSASEYDAIVAMLNRQTEQKDLARIRLLAELTDDVPEWSTTMKLFSNVGGKPAATDLRQMHILKGFAKIAESSDMLLWPDGTLSAQRKCESPKISIRGVRSATPRFLVP